MAPFTRSENSRSARTRSSPRTAVVSTWKRRVKRVTGTALLPHCSRAADTGRGAMIQGGAALLETKGIAGDSAQRRTTTARGTRTSAAAAPR